jgi:aspartate oxidase
MTEPPAQQLTTDVLVVGGGVAALRTAIAACEAGARVLVCAKGIAGRSGNTVVSTADISAYVPGLGADDSEEIFAADTLGSGASIADDGLVRLLVEGSGPALLDLERHGITLLRDNGAIDRTRGAGHSRARTYRADSKGLGPNKGLALSVPLAQRAEALGAQLLHRTPVVRFVVEDGALRGAVAIGLQDNVVYGIRAGAAVLAAGGAAHLYARTNGTADATGDALALALRAGAAARDLEFVQWHPTRMDEPVSLFLTNGLLADGAVFRDRAGREFMADYDERANLAPRDVLAKAIYLESMSERGVQGGVYLDCSPIPTERIALRHAYLAETLQKHGVDFPRQWLVVSPATHFMMGGIAIGLDAASSLPGLFAAGESAAGIHGANRLGGNAFCEGLVFGTIAGESAAAFARGAGLSNGPVPVPESLVQRINPTAADARPALSELWHHLREQMWRDASIVRERGSLDRATTMIAEVRAEAERIRGRTVAEAARVLDLITALDCAQAIVTAAIFREESRGAHWRSDFPETSPAWLGSIMITWPESQSSPTLAFRAKAAPDLLSPIGGMDR